MSTHFGHPLPDTLSNGDVLVLGGDLVLGPDKMYTRTVVRRQGMKEEPVYPFNVTAVERGKYWIVGDHITFTKPAGIADID